jgi:hypothetical protein
LRRIDKGTADIRSSEPTFAPAEEETQRRDSGAGEWTHSSKCCKDPRNYSLLTGGFNLRSGYNDTKGQLTREIAVKAYTRPWEHGIPTDTAQQQSKRQIGRVHDVRGKRTYLPIHRRSTLRQRRRVRVGDSVGTVFTMAMAKWQWQIRSPPEVFIGTICFGQFFWDIRGGNETAVGPAAGSVPCEGTAVRVLLIFQARMADSLQGQGLIARVT